MLAMLVLGIYNLMDTLWLTRISSQAVAAYAITFPIQMLFTALGVGTGVGAGSYAARMFGTGELEKAKQTAGQVVFLSLLFGILTITLILIFPEAILKAFGATSSTLEPAKSYLIPIVFGAPFLLFMMMSNNLIRAEGRPNLSMLAQLVFAITGAILDPLLIFGWGSFPEMGIVGAAIAAVAGQTAASFISLYFISQTSSKYDLSWRYLIPRPSIIYAIYQTGLPSVLINLAFGLVVIVYNHILSDYGNLALATLGICFRITGLVMMVLFGIGHGVMPLVGYNLGARFYRRLIDTVTVSIRLSVIISGASCMLILILAGPLISLFTQDPDLKTTSLPALRIFISMLILSGPSVVWINMFIGIGKGMTSMMLLLFRDVLFLIPCLYIFKHCMGLPGVWLAQPVAVLMGFIIIFIWAKKELRSIEKRIQRNCG